ncbi:MAG: hypothetical protein HYU65_04585 [Armatimonadetes bacterium]|nr:hypothetical protein [Armatimonadota bacterium]
MSRVMVLGPKRLLGQVIEEVQRQGVLHVDRVEAEEETASGVAPMHLADDDARTLHILERALTRADGVLTLLPRGPGDGAAAEQFVETSPEALDAELSDIEGRVRDLTRQRLELEDERTLIESYEGAVRVLSPLLGALAGSKALETIGFILNTKDLTAVAAIHNELSKATGNRVEVVSRSMDEKRIGVVVAFRRQDGDRVRAVLARAGVAEMRLPARFAQDQPADAIALMERRKRDIPHEIERVDSGLAAVTAQQRPRLLAMRAVLADRLGRMNVVPDLAQSHYAFILHGWSPTRAVPEIRSRLRTRFGRDVVVYDAPADPHEAERVPVLLDNHPLIRPFQRLLGLFQPPRYGAWDPSPVMAITFPIFVGLVIGDVGYGLLLFLLGWAFGKMARAGRALEMKFLSLRFPAPLLADLAYLIRVCAFWMIVFGVIYAEVFGNLPELLFHIEPPFNRVHETTQYFLFIIGAGILMIFLGLLVHLVQSLRHRHTVGVFESVVIMLGTAGLLLFLGARGEMIPAGLGPVGLFLFVGGAAVAVASLVFERDVIKRFLWIIESAAAFGHILSHARLMAFGLAAAALATAANELGAQAGGIGIVFGILVAAIAQMMFFMFTIIGHTIQPARLHWVEFFTKFKYHEETGRAYRPFQKSAT